MSLRNICAVVAAGLFIAGCNSQQTTLPPPGSTPPPPAALFLTGAATSVHDYGLPISSASTPAFSFSGLTAASGMAIDSAGKLYVVNDNAPHAVYVFAPPFSASSTPVATINLPAADTNPFTIALDASGDVWVNQCSATGMVYEFTPPFSGTITPTPAITLTTVNVCPTGLGFDGSGNLYVANTNSGTNTVSVWTAPIHSGDPPAGSLTGLNNPQGLGFDAAHNLYVTNKGDGSIARFNAPISLGASPSITDPSANTGLPTGGGYTQINFDSAGNMYVADCGTQLFEYPLATTPFSNATTPSVTFTTPDSCGAGVVIGQ